MKSVCWVQVHTLLKGLEKIAASADIPMLVAGDFNSVPGSAAHSLLVNRVVESNHPVSTLTATSELSLTHLVAAQQFAHLLAHMLLANDRESCRAQATC